MAEDDVQLGFLQTSDPAWFDARFFPSKAGGKPAWINPKDVPSNEVLKCPSCNEPRCFLLQIYAPLESIEQAFHRMLYVFCCRRGACLKNSRKSILVLRSQLPQENPFFEDREDDLGDLDEPPEEDEDSIKFSYRKEQSAPLCTVCGQPGNKKCGGCLSTRYCSAVHQKLHWNQGKHTSHCSHMKANPDPTYVGRQEWIESNPILFNEFEIITESEEEMKKERNAELEAKQQEMLDKYNEELEEEKRTGEVDKTEFKEEDMPKNQHDELFIKFQTVIDIDSTQVLRYTTATGQEPLWMGSKGVLAFEDVPKCSLCGSERVFELQILPQIIYHLKVQRNAVSGDPEDEIDFGVLAVYTCKASCSIDPKQSHQYSSGAYAIEYLYQQKYE